MPMKPNTQAAYKLLHDGSLVFAEAERVGLRIDTGYLKEQRSRIDAEVEALTDELSNSPELKEWRRKYRTRFNLMSGHQLAFFLYEIMELEPPKISQDTEAASADEEALTQLIPDVPWLEKIIRLRKLDKVRGTYIENLTGEAVRGVVHPFFNFHTTATFRSSSSAPNFQNIPIRDPEIGKIIRKAIFPRKGHQLLEVDFGSLEVRIAACYHHDPTMFRYIKDPSTDMHRDMAMACFKLDEDLVAKPIRQAAKNKFVFPEFYGSYWATVARDLWQYNRQLKLKLPDGTSLSRHMKKSGLTPFRRFESHIKEVEREFWEDRFSVYTQWKEDHYARYCKKGYFDTLTGFRCSGFMSRNQVINYPVQGSAFHCLLWSAVRVALRLAKTKGCSTRIVGQIHDSLILDVRPAELDFILKTVFTTMLKSLPAYYKWIEVPLEVEAELAGVDCPWFEKKEIEYQLN